MIHDADGRVGDTSASAHEGSDHDKSIGSSPANRAMSSRDSPSGVVDPSSAEMSITRCPHRSLVRELASGSVGPTNNATFPIIEDLASGEG